MAVIRDCSILVFKTWHKIVCLLCSPNIGIIEQKVKGFAIKKIPRLR